jgi:hypothetical protein
MDEIAIDSLIIGDGPAAMGYLCGYIQNNRNQKLRLGIITGQIMKSLGVFNSTMGPAEKGRIECSKIFGLPSVRAFGAGGTTALWHGGMFLPTAEDVILSATGKTVDIPKYFEGLISTDSVKNLPLQAILNKRRDPAHSSNFSNWRDIFIPFSPPPRISASDNFQERLSFIDEGVAQRFEICTNEKIKTIIFDGQRFKKVFSNEIVLAAGCIGTLDLLIKSNFASSLSFCDHLHVFVGTLRRSRLPSALLGKLGPKLVVGTSFAQRWIWKTTVTYQGQSADVGLGFRAVANPNFPRSGRAFADLVAHRSQSPTAKLSLALRHPATSIEMLAYKFGIELPFENYLVHATVSPRQKSGVIREMEIEFVPDRDYATKCATYAFREFCTEFNLEIGTDSVNFESNDISNSFIGGAQFSGVTGQIVDLPEMVKIVDTSALGYTSIYNQTLTSLCYAFDIGHH